MAKEEKSKKVLQAEERFKKAQAELLKAKREEKAKARKEQDHHKFIMGGIIVKYFPDAYEFSEQEMHMIIACAFKNRDIQNMIRTVVNEREKEVPGTAHNEEAGNCDEEDQN